MGEGVGLGDAVGVGVIEGKTISVEEKIGVDVRRPGKRMKPFRIKGSERKNMQSRASRTMTTTSKVLFFILAQWNKSALW